MTPEEKRIAIAEACGWENVRTSTFRGESVIGNHKWTSDHRVPDYPADLNAMHEAEKVLTDNERVAFRIVLMGNSDGRKAVFRTVEAALCHATATQRADAFLMTIGKIQA